MDDNHSTISLFVGLTILLFLMGWAFNAKGKAA